MRHILFPNEIEPASPVGGKAHGLADMHQCDLPVPPWFVLLPSAFDTSVQSEMRTELDPLNAQRLVCGAHLAAEVAAETETALEQLAHEGGLFAVRSSALEEDSATLSFAGQLESVLFVVREDVPAKIVQVWASGFGDRLLRYRREAGLDPLAGAPAVIVQRMVDGEASGVAFSADPVSGRRAVAVVAAVPGLGSALVSGEAAADTWRVDRAGEIIERTVAPKRVMHRPDPTAPGGVSAVPVPTARVDAPALSDEEVRAVARLARRAEAHFGRPQDIEWTIDDGALFLLQSRPITTLADVADPDGLRTLWDNANIIESYSGVTTPLTFSFARRAYENVYREFCRLMRVPKDVIEARSETFAAMIGLLRGRVYYNVFNWYRVIALLPGYASNRRFLEQMLGMREARPEDLPVAEGTVGERLRDRVRLAFLLVVVAARVLSLPRRVDRFHARLARTLGPVRSDLSGLRPEELVAYYRGLERRLLRHWDAPVVNDFAAMIFHGLLRRLSADWIGDPHGTLSNDLLAADRGMISEEPARRVREMARLAAKDEVLVSLLCDGGLPRIREALRERPRLADAVVDYVARFGDRCMEELKLESITLHDDPLPLLRAVGQYARRAQITAPDSTAAGVPPSRPEAETRVRAALSGRPLRRLAFAWVLRHARARVRARENLRFERTRVFGRARQILVELGCRLAAVDCLDAPRDVFYLELDEVLGYVEGWATTTDLKGLVALRKAEFAAYRAQPAPADRFETRGMIHKGQAREAATLQSPATSDSLRGQGCSPGVVRGPVRLVTDPKSACLQPGEIIVAERTDPGWVMIFPSASGLLIERGSLLSHSAIVARELGLPTIVSLPGVTRWLVDGDWVELDGATGLVTKVTRNAAEERNAGR